MDASKNLGVLLTSRATLVTQLTSRELVLLLAQDHGDMEWKWGLQKHVRSSGFCERE